MVGFAVHKRQRAVSADIVKEYVGVPVPTISDSMSRMAAGGTRIRPMHDGTYMAGVAITVKTRPGDNLMLQKALDIAGPGDIIVVDAGGDLTNALMGEMMATHAQGRKISGIVINGAVRDSAALRESSLPIFAAGVTHRGPYKYGPGEINVPIAIDGMVIQPGDVVVGDEDGFVCVPFEHAEHVLRAAKQQVEEEAAAMPFIRDQSRDRSWVDETLKKLGCDFVD